MTYKTNFILWKIINDFSNCLGMPSNSYVYPYQKL